MAWLEEPFPAHDHRSYAAAAALTRIPLAAIDNAGYFEADVSRPNRFRDELVSTPYELAPDGTVRPLPGPGLGLEVDEDFLRAHPVVDGPSYVVGPVA